LIFQRPLFVFVVIGFKIQQNHTRSFFFIFIPEFKAQPEEKTHQYQTKNEMCIHFILLFKRQKIPQIAVFK